MNEVVIPLGNKDRWNASDPRGDSQFAGEYTAPEVTRAREPALPGARQRSDDRPRRSRRRAAHRRPRALNFTGPTQADLIRLNTSIAPTAPVGAGNRLGVLGGDLAGFPNGRRLEDDVTDIELRAFACGYGRSSARSSRASASAPATRTGRRTTCSATAWTRTTKPFMTSFPYLGDSTSGGTTRWAAAGRCAAFAGTVAALAATVLLFGGSRSAARGGACCRRSRPTRRSLVTLGPRLPEQRARETADASYLTRSRDGAPAGAAARPSRRRGDGRRPRRARALPTRLPRRARARAAGADARARLGAAARAHRRRARRARPLPRGVRRLRRVRAAASPASPRTRASPTGASCSATATARSRR